MNDLHLEKFYKANETDNSCRGANSPYAFAIDPDHPSDLANKLGDTGQWATLGRPGCDSPASLVELMATRLDQLDKDVDIVIMAGDFVAHGIAAHYGEPTHGEVLREALEESLDIVKSRLPNAILVPSVGNNDVLYHYQPPDCTNKTEFYGYLFDLWFNQVKQNEPFAEHAKQSMLEGGYFRMRVSKRLSVISLNTLYLSTRNDFRSQCGEAERMLIWLRNELEEEKDATHGFIISFHIFPGLYYPGYDQQFFYDPYVAIYKQIVKQNRHKIILQIGAHTHWADVRSYVSPYNPFSSAGLGIGAFLGVEDEEEHEDVHYENLHVSPSVSPIFGNNPGVTTFDVHEDSLVAYNFTWHFFDLYKSFTDSEQETPLVEYREVNLEKEFGLMNFTIGETWNFLKRLQGDEELFRQYLVKKLGFSL